MGNSLVLRGVIPLGVICMIPLVGALQSAVPQGVRTTKKKISRARLMLWGALQWLPVSLFLSFCLTPSVSLRVFRTWDCVGFAVSDEEEHYFLEADYSLSCGGSPEYDHVIILAWVLVAIWPVGMVLLYSSLLFPCREALTREDTDTMLVRATAFLHRDYRAPLCVALRV